MPDVVHNDDQGWWFWNEDFLHRQGPFDTEVEARKQMADYYMLVDRSYRNINDANHKGRRCAR